MRKYSDWDNNLLIFLYLRDYVEPALKITYFLVVEVKQSLKFLK